MKKIIQAIILVIILMASSNTVFAARDDSVWQERIGTYLETIWPEGRDILINGIDKYLNFGTDSGSTGYGFRDNAGTIEIKDDGGSWGAITSYDSPWTTSGSDIYYDTGDVMIGTTTNTTGAALNVVGGILTDSLEAGTILVSGSSTGDLDGNGNDLLNWATLNTHTIPGGTSTFLIASDIGSSVQAYDAQLTTIAGLTPASSLIIGDGLGDWTTVTPANFVTNNNILTTTNTKTVSNKTLTAPKFTSGGFIADANGNEQLIFTTTASAVNELTLTNAATGNAPRLSVTGGDTNVDFKIDAKGSGDIILNSTATGNVGIGQTSPGDLLHIGNDATNPAISLDYANTGSGLIKFRDAGTVSAQIVYDDTANEFQFDAGGAGSTKMVIESTGNVGIGTTAPQANLSIGAVSSSITAFVANPTLALTGDIIFEPGSGNDVQIFNYRTSDMQFGNGGTAQMVIDSSGNVGIGTTAPDSLLSVQGAGAAATFGNDRSSSGYLRLLGVGGISYIQSGLTSSTGSEAPIRFTNRNAAETWMTINTNGNVGIGTTSPAQKLSVSGGDIVIDNNQAYRVTDSGGVSRFGLFMNTSDELNLGPTGGAYPILFNPGASTAMTIQTNGNVGIGTTAPARKLHISDSVANYVTTHMTGATPSALLLGSEGSRNAIYSWTGPTTGVGRPLVFFTGATEVVRIDTSGNVGIGTTGPGAKLDIEASSGKLLEITRTGVASLEAYGTTADGDSFVYLTGDGGTSQLQFRDDGTLTYNTGNVGIGTTGPSYKLDVTDSVNNFSASIANTHATGGDGLLITAGTDASAQVLRLRDKTGSTEVLTALASGNVGIGTTNPSKLFDVFGAGGSRFTVSSDGIVTQNPVGSGVTLTWDTNKAIIKTNQGTDNLTFGIAGSEKMRIDTSGNVGIGTTTPASKLAVFGNAILDGVSRYLNFGSTAGSSGYGIRDNAGTMEYKNSGGSWAGIGSGGGGTAQTNLYPPDYYPPAVVVSSEQFNSNTTARVQKITVPYPLTISKVTLHPVTVTTAGTVEIGIYSEDGQTQYLATSTASISTTGVFTHTLAASVDLDPGTYYFALVPESTADITFRNFDPASTYRDLMFGVTSEPDYAGNLTVTASTLPGTFTPTSIDAGSGANDKLFNMRFD